MICKNTDIGFDIIFSDSDVVKKEKQKLLTVLEAFTVKGSFVSSGGTYRFSFSEHHVHSDIVFLAMERNGILPNSILNIRYE